MPCVPDRQSSTSTRPIIARMARCPAADVQGHAIRNTALHAIHTGAAASTISARRRAAAKRVPPRIGNARKIQFAASSRGMANVSRAPTTAHTIMTMLDTISALLMSPAIANAPSSSSCAVRGVLSSTADSAIPIPR